MQIWIRRVYECAIRLACWWLVDSCLWREQTGKLRIPLLFSPINRQTAIVEMHDRRSLDLFWQFGEKASASFKDFDFIPALLVLCTSKANLYSGNWKLSCLRSATIKEVKRENVSSQRSRNLMSFYAEGKPIRSTTQSISFGFYNLFGSFFFLSSRAPIQTITQRTRGRETWRCPVFI